MKRLLVLISILFTFNYSVGNSFMPGVTTEKTPRLASGAAGAGTATGVAPRIPGDHHPTSLPVSYQNGNCVIGEPCPGAPIPRARPERSCLDDPSQTKCQSDEDDSTISKEDDETDKDEEISERNVEPQGPTGPTPACQNAIAQTNQCSQVPQVNVGVPRGNILGNYDAATETMRNGSQTLGGYSSRCQSLMGQCANQCSGGNPFDQNLKNQCYQYQNQVSQAQAESQNLNAMSLQTEQAAATIRSGQSDFKKTMNIGQGVGIEADMKVGATEIGIKPVSGNKLLSTVKMERYDKEEPEEEEKKQEDKIRKASQPSYMVATATPIRKASVDGLLPFKKKRVPEKNETEKVAADMHKGYYKLGKRSELKKKKLPSTESPDEPYKRVAQFKRSRSGLVLPEEILHRQWQQQQRDLASQRGRTRTDQFIFNSICLRYGHFAKDFGINEGSTQCPPPY